MNINIYQPFTPRTAIPMLAKIANCFCLLLAAWPGNKISEAACRETQRASRAGTFCGEKTIIIIVLPAGPCRTCCTHLAAVVKIEDLF